MPIVVSVVYLSAFWLVSLGLGGAVAKFSQREDNLAILEPSIPVWPESYSLGYEFSLPYTAEVQEREIAYDVQFFKLVSEPGVTHLRIESLNGSNIFVLRKKSQFELVPRLYSQACAKAAASPEAQLEALPDLRGWEYQGSLLFRDKEAYLWQYQAQYGEKEVQYKFYVSADGVPLRFHMLGTEAFGGAHYGVYPDIIWCLVCVME